MVAEALRRRKLARRVALEVPSFLAGLHVVAASDLLMNVPVPLVNDVAAALDLVVRPAPLPLPSVPFALLWHDRFQHDEAHRWARDVVAAAVDPRFSRPPVAAR
ncbi:hypothetical protein GF068_15920 [Polyangium spumosum]|uniref:LysR substrate-binding domain-containing protein n=1 Tax=Polyangium spumosum TaxID=889282 RepID=A0A6N7PN02_9BACT|nr:hypothetical protein [Polyangium spumosum]